MPEGIKLSSPNELHQKQLLNFSAFKKKEPRFISHLSEVSNKGPLGALLHVSSLRDQEGNVSTIPTVTGCHGSVCGGVEGGRCDFHTCRSFHLEVMQVNSTCILVTKASHKVPSNFKATRKCDLTLCLEREEKYLSETLATTTQHWQLLSEMDTHRHPGGSANWHRFSRGQAGNGC